jgi:formate dehydrogenase maturation protein FdhE
LTENERRNQKIIRTSKEKKNWRSENVKKKTESYPTYIKKKEKQQHRYHWTRLQELKKNPPKSYLVYITPIVKIKE